MEFSLSARCQELQSELTKFMEDHVYPAEAVYEEQLATGDRHGHPPIMEELKAEARRRGLWNLFLPHKTQWTEGLSNIDSPRWRRSWAVLSRLLGCNCSAPDP